MKRCFVLLILFSSLLPLLSACNGILLQSAMRSGHTLTKDELDAYASAGFDPYTCFTFSGPPPTGSAVIIGVPKGSKPSFTFGNNCQIIQSTLYFGPLD